MTVFRGASTSCALIIMLVPLSILESKLFKRFESDSSISSLAAGAVGRKSVNEYLERAH